MKALTLINFLLLTNLSFANYNGSISFTEKELQLHKKSISKLTAVSARCLENYRSKHLLFYFDNCKQQTLGTEPICLSKYYGERRYSKIKGAVREDGKPLAYLPDALEESGFSKSYLDLLEPNSCVGMALDCLKQGLLETDQENIWLKVLKFTKENGVGGTALQHALSLIGWKTYYWNPAKKETIIADMKAWDTQELEWKSKGRHLYRYNRVMNRGRYWFNKVDDKTTLVGFDSRTPSILKSVQFWIGTAHTGYHVFPGTYTSVVEAHSTRKITALDNLEFSVFSPLTEEGGPKWSPKEKYRSGLISIPPKKEEVSFNSKKNLMKSAAL